LTKQQVIFFNEVIDFVNVFTMLNTHTVERLVIYNRVLKGLAQKRSKWVTSKEIARKLSKTPAQVRRDLSILGRKGKPGVGYNIEVLINDLDGVLGRNRIWNVAIIGAGNLGKALFSYPGFKREGFKFKAIFDNAPDKVGKKWDSLVIKSSGEIERAVKKGGIDIAVITVPKNSAQGVAEALVKAGIKNILNFAPVMLDLPEDVRVRNTDLSLELENLSCFICNTK